MEARKGNKVYQVDARGAERYAAQGFDIYEEGELVMHAKGKTVPVAEYEKLKAELEALKGGKAEEPAEEDQAEESEEPKARTRSRK